MAHEVFVSYSSLDKPVAEAICSSLEQEGIRVWIAPRDIVPGAPWGEAIINGINTSKLMIVVFSSNSNNSDQVLREVERAVSKRVAIIPFRIENILPSKSMEYFLSSSHWMDALIPPIEHHIQKLTNTVKLLASKQFAMDEVADSSSLFTATSGTVTLPSAWSSLTTLRTRYLLAIVVISLLAVGSGIWWFKQPPDKIDATAIAVMPFRNLAQDETIDYLSLAMPAELNSQLSRTTAAIIRPLDSVKNYKNQSWTAPEVAKTLRVGTVVGGSFWRSEQQLRVSVDVIDSRQNRQVWAETFQELLSELVNLLDRMVPKVAEALRLRLEMKPAGEMLGTKNSEVYELYLRALSLGQEITDENNNAAIRFLKQAVTKEPDFARAHAALAEAYVTRFYWNFSNDTEWLNLAETSARQALKLDATLPEAHNALAYALDGKGQRVDAAREFFASARAAPNYVAALVNVGRYLFYMAEFDAAIEVLDRIAIIDPTNNVHIRKAMCYFFSGRLEEGRRENHLAEQRAHGVDQLTLVAFTWVWVKELDSAERVLNRLEKEQPAALSISEIRAWLYTARGQIPQAREQMEIIAKRPTYGIADEIATLYAIQGEREQAIEWLTKAVEMGAPNYAWYSSEFFTSVRGDPRYEAILKQLEEEYRPLRPETKEKS